MLSTTEKIDSALRSLEELQNLTGTAQLGLLDILVDGVEDFWDDVSLDALVHLEGVQAKLGQAQLSLLRGPIEQSEETTPPSATSLPSLTAQSRSTENSELGIHLPLLTTTCSVGPWIPDKGGQSAVWTTLGLTRSSTCGSRLTRPARNTFGGSGGRWASAARHAGPTAAG